jgi:hypothetical protein
LVLYVTVVLVARFGLAALHPAFAIRFPYLAVVDDTADDQVVTDHVVPEVEVVGDGVDFGGQIDTAFLRSFLVLRHRRVGWTYWSGATAKTSSYAPVLSCWALAAAC